MNKSRPTIGFAFSGASSRSMFYIGFLEVLNENGFPTDYIAAMSGGAIVAASYACGTLPELKKLANSLDKELVFNIIERSKGRGGLYSLKKVEAFLRVYTKNLRFEDVKPQLGFVATDIVAGEEVVLQMGDIARAACASCTLPFVFEPLEWGNKKLVDGGVVNIVPGNVVRDAGIDIVIGVDMRATRHIFSRWQILLKKIVDGIKQILWPDQLQVLWQRLAGLLDYSDDMNALQVRSSYPSILSVADRSIGLAIEAQKKDSDSNFNCDLLIAPDINHVPAWKRYLFLHFTDFSNTAGYYNSGRETARKYLPQMWQLLAEKEAEVKNQDEKIKAMLENK